MLPGHCLRLSQKIAKNARALGYWWVFSPMLIPVVFLLPVLSWLKQRFDQT